MCPIRPGNLAIVLLALGAGPAPGSAAQPPNGTWLTLARVGQYGRAPIHTDALEIEIVAGTWTTPQPGDEVRVDAETLRIWQPATPDAEGWLRDPALRGGYACWLVERDTPGVMLLEARGHGIVYVNGAPHAGDPYDTGWLQTPVQLNAGANTLLFLVGRGQLRAELVEPPAPLMLSTRDTTLPDIIRGEGEVVWAALPVLNATEEWQRDLSIEVELPDGRRHTTALDRIAPLTARKMGFEIPCPADTTGDELPLIVRLRDGGATHHQVELTLRIRDAMDQHKRTFISDIDGSVQYYATTPAHLPPDYDGPAALFLTLHGASVEATNQANAYDPKDWGHVVAPTNRRPYGFDWEDWGRLDALEVLRQAQDRWDIDPRRIYLTGHSMGGHGVWQIGATHPDLFAALGPSAAWPSFWSYGGGATYENPTPVEQVLDRAVNPSKTLELSRNYLHHGIYILHGDQDDNVPVSLAREMRAHLAEFHPNFAYYEQPGAGHWWGDACVDWPRMFDFFKYHTRPETHQVRHIEFHTANPAISASCHWAMIGRQQRSLMPSSIDLHFDPTEHRVYGTTDNVEILVLILGDLLAPDPDDQDTQPAPDEPLSIELDGQTVTEIRAPRGRTGAWFQRIDDTWQPGPDVLPPVDSKYAHRNGPFKNVFVRNFALIVGTSGSDEDTRANFDKARYDAETFGYRGNGSVMIITDQDCLANDDEFQSRNLILYGNAETNAAWKNLLADSPVQIHPGKACVATHTYVGDDLACLLVRPHQGHPELLVGAVAGTGPAGMRLAVRLPYFLSGVAYPDYIVLGPETLTAGTTGIRAAGFFGPDWDFDPADFAENPGP